MKRRATLLAVLTVIAALAWAASQLFPSASAPSGTEFVLLDGRKLSLRALRGRPVLVNFWATTCAPCMDELPDLVQLYEKWHPLGFELIAVAMPYDPPSLVQDFVRRHAVPYPVALDVDGRITQAFDGVSFVPVTYLVAPNGKIALRYTGRLDIVKTRRIIMKYLQGTSPDFK